MKKAERLQMEIAAKEEAKKQQAEQDKRDHEELMKTGYRVENCPVCGNPHAELACDNSRGVSGVAMDMSETYYITCSACGLRGTQAEEIWKAIRNWNNMVREYAVEDKHENQGA